ncbi:N-acetylglucosamine-6-phosphate deacetylase [Sneathiella marina]|uniref:N-acetylglucosamine-6-phosphate deacetylase n=1 Tax=Sneathiella marina TaxID=2950108 RepID=A0ABY4W8P2_9PROT|nr:N-acetylglucosamine-6-phosphate deacetylase [Sneathiella marina]USG63149.1 N-acetylglucosamine-6-phosphate deacetylase [Sneathiella marina]
MFALSNGKIYAGDTWLENHSVLVDNGKIVKICNVEDIPSSCPVDDLEGGFLVPGFVDVQVNGGGGVLLNNSPDKSSIVTVAAAHRKFGTTSLAPTFITDEKTKMQEMAGAVETALMENSPGIKGIHFEGPFLNIERKGVHDAKFIRLMDDCFLKLIADHDLGQVIVTLAPEKVTLDYIRTLVEAGAIVCAGHTNATYDQTQAAMDAGLTGFTHLHNAMPAMQSRKPGVIGAALENQDCFCGVIADGHHVHWATLGTTLAAKGADRIMLVTDAMSSVGTDETEFMLGDQRIDVRDGKCVTAEGVLAGSALDMATAVRNVSRLPGQSLLSAVKMASTTPATFLGLNDKIGKIQSGFDADLVLLNKEVEAVRTWIAGEQV